MENQNEILDILIRREADLLLIDSKRKRTALTWAASSGRDEAVQLLLNSKPELLSHTDGEHLTPLACAYVGGHWKTARLLLGAGDSANAKVHGATLLEWAMVARNEEFVRLLLEHHAAPDTADSQGVPLLITAIKRNLPNVVEWMVDCGADVQCKDKTGFSALMWAVWYNNEAIVEFLLERNADLHAVDCKGTTVQDLARQIGNQTIIHRVRLPC
jgi:ankyrin repeat protein